MHWPQVMGEPARGHQAQESRALRLPTETGGHRHRILCRRLGRRHALHQGTAHNRPIGPPIAHLAGLVRAGNAKTHRHRRRPKTLELSHQPGNTILQLGAFPSHPSNTD